MLKDDQFLFAQSSPDTIYVFSSIYEKRMAIEKVKLRLKSTKLDNLSKILIFVFDNLGDANYLMRYNEIT